MFFGRSSELGKLDEMYNSNRFEFAVIYGRRRVGKTTLIREFIKDKNAMFYAASESTAQDNLLFLSRCIAGKNSAPVFTDYENALSAVFEKAETERFVFVIDEFPYLAAAYRGISSLLQIMIDHNRENSKLMLILCGSSMSFMESQVLGYQSPLYGRRTAQFKILPFSYFDSLPFLQGFSKEDQALLYGVAGGIPEYLSKIYSHKSVKENVIELFLTPSGHFFEEPSNLIKQELREPSTYNGIIEAIARGASRLSEISTKSHAESNKCGKYLTSLIALGLVKKELPVTETAGKKSIYLLEDQMFRFWYRFVFPNMSAIVAGLGERVYVAEVEPQLSAYMGLVFEEICKQWMLEQMKQDALPFFSGKLGRWWGNNPRLKRQEEIDILAYRENQALLGECKWTNSLVDINVFDDLREQSKLFSYEECWFYIFAKRGFTARLKQAAEQDERVKLVAFEEML